MSLQEYFKNAKGVGILSTADDKGKVNAAVYAEPHVIDETHVAFIMGDRLTHANVRKNPYAVYLFKEDGPAWEGKRLYLKMEKETGDFPVIQETCKLAWPGPYCSEKYLKGSFLVIFAVESVLPLVVYDQK
jgi:hypothetical protein